MRDSLVLNLVAPVSESNADQIFGELSRQRHDPETLEEIIKNNPNFNQVDEKGRTVVSFMVEYNIQTSKTIQMALKRGADISRKMSFHNMDSIFEGIIRSGDIDSVRVAMGHLQMHVNSSEHFFQKVLHEIVNSGTSDILSGVIDVCEEMNGRNAHGETPLHLATRKGYIRMMDILLSHGADVNAVDDKGNTALHLAAEMMNQEVLEVLVKYKPDANLRNSAGKTPLIVFCEKGEISSFSFNCLLDAGANINLLDDNEYKTPDSCWFGITFNGPSKKGCSALYYSVLNNYVGNVTMLLEMGADMEGFLAAYWESEKCITMTQILLANIVLRKSKNPTWSHEDVDQFNQYSLRKEENQKFVYDLMDEMRLMMNESMGSTGRSLWDLALWDMSNIEEFSEDLELDARNIWCSYNFAAFPVFGHSLRRKTIRAFCKMSRTE